MNDQQKTLAATFRQVLEEHENGALGGIDLAGALAQAVSVSPPTAERIEAAAKAIYGDDADWGYVNDYGGGEVAARWEHLGGEVRDMFRRKARAALTAAAGVTPQEPGERDVELRQTISDLRLELADAGEGWRAALEVMENHKCHDQAERAYTRAVAAEDALAAPAQVDGSTLPTVTRVTLAARTGPRSAEHWDYEGVELAVQDDGRTLKILPLKGDTQ